MTSSHMSRALLNYIIGYRFLTFVSYTIILHKKISPFHIHRNLAGRKQIFEFYPKFHFCLHQEVCALAIFFRLSNPHTITVLSTLKCGLSIGINDTTRYSLQHAHLAFQISP